MNIVMVQVTSGLCSDTTGDVALLICRLKEAPAIVGLVS